LHDTLQNVRRNDGLEVTDQKILFVLNSFNWSREIVIFVIQDGQEFIVGLIKVTCIEGFFRLGSFVCAGVKDKNFEVVDD